MVEFFLILGAIVIYFAPSLVAAWVRHPKLAYIGGLNAALGVTGVGWAGALVWALRRRKVVAMSYHGDMQMPRSFNTALLAVTGLVVGVAIVATVGVNRLQNPDSQAAAPVYASDATEVTSTPAPQWRDASAAGADTASLQSRNSLTPPAPFKSGPATLSLIRRAGSAAVSLDLDGELACSYAPAGNSIQVRFDGGPAQTFACAPAPAGARAVLFDGDHSTAYLADPAAFLARLKGTHHLDITVGFADVTAPESMTFDLPPPDLAVSATLAAAAASPAPAMALAAVASAPAGEDSRALRHHHKPHARSAVTTYVDGVPGHRGA